MDCSTTLSNRRFWICIVVCIAAFVSDSGAQSRDLMASVNIGLTSPILDNGSGFVVGVNPSYSLSDRFSAEGRLSYSNNKITGAFLSGAQGRVRATNALAGARLYFSPVDRKVRWYLNLMVGVSYVREERDTVVFEPDFGTGMSGGFYLEASAFMAGVGFEAPGVWKFEIGYVF